MACGFGSQENAAALQEIARGALYAFITIAEANLDSLPQSLHC
jgi:hypothetical protein